VSGLLASPEVSMTNRSKFIFLAVVATIGIVLVAEWVQRPGRLRAQFIGHLYHGRYVEADEMLLPPSAIVVGADGGLTIVAHDGGAMPVPATKLPFMSGGGRSLKSGEFSATALGPSTNGILNSDAVSLRLTLDGYNVCIVSIDT